MTLHWDKLSKQFSMLYINFFLTSKGFTCQFFVSMNTKHRNSVKGLCIFSVFKGKKIMCTFVFTPDLFVWYINPG